MDYRTRVREQGLARVDQARCAGCAPGRVQRQRPPDPPDGVSHRRTAVLRYSAYQKKRLEQERDHAKPGMKSWITQASRTTALTVWPSTKIQSLAGCASSRRSGTARSWGWRPSTPCCPNKSVLCRVVRGPLGESTTAYLRDAAVAVGTPEGATGTVGRSHSDTWVGCIVCSTTPSSSVVRTSRSTCWRSRALNAWIVWAAS